MAESESSGRVFALGFDPTVSDSPRRIRVGSEAQIIIGGAKDRGNRHVTSRL